MLRHYTGHNKSEYYFLVHELLLNITTTILNIIQRRVFYLKYDASETGLPMSSGGTYSIGTLGLSPDTSNNANKV
jgi:hypothetical protein